MNVIEFLYYAGYSLKKRRAIRNQKRLPVRVVSIGNITTGGTGKTPATIAVATEAKKRGYSPVVLTRGYGGKRKGPFFVSSTPSQKGETFSSLVDDAGDEPVLIAARLGDVPVVKCADRFEGGAFALQSLGHPAKPVLFILDDGFQHWRLYRDVDVVLLDGINPFGNGRLLPLGRLRGPVGELADADIFLITKARNSSLDAKLRAINPRAPAFLARYAVRGLKDTWGNMVSPDILAGKRVFAFCGIANAESFRQTVQVFCRDLAGFRAYRDHHRYTKADIDEIVEKGKERKAEFFVTTEKDMVKVRDFTVPARFLTLEVDLAIDQEFYDRLFSELVRKR